MKRPYKKYYTQGDDYMVSSPDEYGTGYIAIKKQIIII
jgi:hypothetical protein